MRWIRWYRCTNMACHCRWTAEARFLWPTPPDLHEVAMNAMVRTVNVERGPRPGLSSAQERAFVDELVLRLGESMDEEVIRACPWQVAREVLAEPRVVPLRRPGAVADGERRAA